MHLFLANDRHMKNVPGKKTDMRDGVWIATLLQVGLLKSNFVTERHPGVAAIHPLSQSVIRYIISHKNRIEKLLQSNGFRLSSFLLDIFGQSGLVIMHQLAQAGFFSNQSLDLCLKARARQKVGEIFSILNGTLSVQQRKQIQMQLEHLADSLANLREVEEGILDDFSQFQGPIGGV
jgi:transposase